MDGATWTRTVAGCDDAGMSRGTDHMPYAELTFWGRLWRQVRASANAGVCPNCLAALPGGDYCSEGCFEEHQANNAW